MNLPNQVVQVIEEKSGEVVYTLRIKEKKLSSKVFAKENTRSGSEKAPP